MRTYSNHRPPRPDWDRDWRLERPEPDSGQDFKMLMGRVIERGDTLIRATHETNHHLRQIDQRLQDGDHRMTDLDGRLTKLEAAPKPSLDMDRLDRLIAAGGQALKYLVPLGVLWSTGSMEMALKAVGLIK